MSQPLEHAAPRVVVVTPRGDLTLAEASPLRTELEGLAEQPATVVVVDLAEVTFIDSSGLGALISGLKAARRSGGQLRLARMPATIRPVFEHTNLLRVFPHFDSLDSAERGR